MEALERRRVAGLLALILCSLCVVEGQRNNTKMSYVCPPQFIRLGHSCYFFSEEAASWQKALFACKDRDSNLSVPARWEDRNLRKYLNKHDTGKKSRWIGGVYDIMSKAWKWGGELRQMHYQSFSKMKKMSPEELQFHCIAMMPELWYRWAPRLCLEQREYICQTKLRKVPKAKVSSFRRRWQRMGKINEITAPSVSQEVNDAMQNDVTVNPLRNPKSFDLQPASGRPNRRTNPIRKNPKNYNLKPNELRKRSRPTARRRLTRPFPGYTWNRRDPEGSFKRNAELLQSGRLHLSPQQIKAHLARLQHLRDKQIRRRKQRERDEWLVNEPKQDLAQTHARTYMVDNNISALHPKTIVEEFDMFPPPPPVAVPRPTRGAG